MLRFALMVTGPAYGTQQSSSAYQFAETLLTTGHKIISVFFYQEGIYNANLFTLPAVDEIDLVRSWQDLHNQHGIALYVCAAAALRRGVINTLKPSTNKLSASNLQDGFLLSGLSMLVEAALTCDRMMQF